MKSISQKLQDDIRAIMEAGLHPNQQKIDVHEPEKDKITAKDFEMLRKGKKAVKEDSVQEEEKKKVVSPFDYKNYTSQIPKKPGEMTGHDSKKISTGTVYTKKPVKENTDIDEARKLEGTYSHSNGNQSKVYKLSGEHDEGDPYHVKLFKGGKHYEPADYFTNDKEDAHATAKSMVKEERTDEAMSHQAKTTMKHIPNPSPALKKAAKDIKPGIAGYRDRIAMLKAGGVKEDVEALDELSKNALGSYVKKATRDSAITRKIASDFEHMSDRARTPGMKQAAGVNAEKYKARSWKRRDGVDKAIDRLTKEEAEQKDYTFAEYLDAARAQYVDEDAVLVANEAFRNKDITLFTDQSQSPEA